MMFMIFRRKSGHDVEYQVLEHGSEDLNRNGSPTHEADDWEYVATSFNRDMAQCTADFLRDMERAVSIVGRNWFTYWQMIGKEVQKAYGIR